MAVVRINEVRDAIAAKINAAWIDYVTAVTTPPTAGQRARESEQDEVVTRARWEIKAAQHRGRKIYLVRASVAGRPASRDDDENDYTFVLYVVERYAGQGAEVPEEWLDARVEFCEWLLNLLSNARAERLLPESDGGGLWPQEAEITAVMDFEELDERKLFVSTLSLMFREQTEAAVEG